ncbi:MAG: benzoate-CoA ligase family protein [Pelagibacterales bacterium]|nr:benzoate-CoA ligase family protein [Pelagibacterales bacterium]
MKEIKNNKYNAAYDLLIRNIDKNPDKIAFIDNNNSITYQELYRKVKAFSYSIKKYQIKENDRIILCMHDSIEYPIVFLGLIWSGIIPICINTMLPKKDYAYMIEDSEAKAIITLSDFKNYFLSIIENKKNKPLLIIDDNDELNCLNKLINQAENSIENPYDSNENDVAFWLYSSGSTGTPKGTLHIHKSLIATANTYAKKIIKINKNDICFSAAKLFFAYGLGNALTFPMSIGATSILMAGRPTAESVSNIIKKYSVTLFYGVPTLYAALLSSNININDYQSLRLSISAGEALPAHLCEKWQKLLGISILDGIGSTEMLHIFISNSIEDTIPGASGRPVEGYKARLINDDGKEAFDDEIAELEVQGPSSAISYWKKPEKSKLTFKENWVKTGDKYIRNKDGIYTYCGRADDMMKVSGQYVSPFEVEAALQNHKDVLEAAVVGEKDINGLIKPKAFIVLNENVSTSKNLELELTNHVKSQLTPFKYPRSYEFIDTLPKTATGKIQRFKLRIKND